MRRICSTNTGCQRHKVFLPALWHSMRVFIGNRGTARPCQGHLDPQLPSLSLEYSLEGRLQRVITVYFITDMAQPTLPTCRPDARPCYMGRIAHWPLLALRGTRPYGLREAFVLACRSEGGRTDLRMDGVLGLSGGACGSGLRPCRCGVDVVERRVACSPSPQHLPSEGLVRPSQLVPKTTVRW
jgi:hypothetical protein